MGTMANELSLGCDCLGQIHYLVSICCAERWSTLNDVVSPGHTSPTMAVL